MNPSLLEEIRTRLTAPSSLPSGYQPERLWPRGATGPDDATREYRAHFVRRMYQGHQWEFLAPNSGESQADFERRRGRTTLNVTRLVIDTLSLLYRYPPARRIEGSSRARQALQRAFTDAGLDLLMLHVDRATRLYGTVAVRPFVRRGAPAFWMYRPDQIRIVDNPDDPQEPLAVILHWPARETGASAAHRRAQAWTRTHFLRFLNDEVVEQRAHAMGRIPLAFFHDEVDFGAFFTGGRGLNVAHQNLILNEKLSDLAHTVKMQGFGVLEITNPDPDQEIALGPATAIRFTVRGDEPYGLQFKQPNAPIGELLADVAASMTRLLQSQRIPESALSVSVTSNTSGVAIHAAGTPLWEDRQERMRLFARFEQDLAQATLAALSEFEAALTPFEPLRVHLDFPEPEPVHSLADRIARDEFALRQGLTSPWEIAYRDDPDGFRDLDEAKARFLARRAELRALGLNIEPLSALEARPSS